MLNLKCYVLPPCWDDNKIASGFPHKSCQALFFPGGFWWQKTLCKRGFLEIPPKCQPCHFVSAITSCKHKTGICQVKRVRCQSTKFLCPLHNITFIFFNIEKTVQLHQQSQIWQPDFFPLYMSVLVKSFHYCCIIGPHWKHFHLYCPPGPHWGSFMLFICKKKNKTVFPPTKTPGVVWPGRGVSDLFWHHNGLFRTKKWRK